MTSKSRGSGCAHGSPACCLTGPFDDEMTRSFYEDYPHLRDIMPACLFEADRGSKTAAAAVPSQSGAASSAVTAAATPSPDAGTQTAAGCVSMCRKKFSMES